MGSETDAKIMEIRKKYEEIDNFDKPKSQANQ